MTQNKSELRHAIRSQRRALTLTQQRLAAQALCRQIASHPHYQAAHHIGAYVASDGEISLAPLLTLARAQGKTCYLPTVISKTEMEFRCFTGQHSLALNRFHIHEPKYGFRPCKVHDLDLILLPLVAFTKDGDRLGMGGGFYDRALAGGSMNQASPILIGCAHELQRVDQLDTESWDIPMDFVATNRRIY